MKHPTVYSLSVAAIVLALSASSLPARPIGFSELSLLVRMHEPEDSIKNEVAERKLLHGLTQPQESILKSQGASDSLIRSLRNSNLVVPKEEAAADEAATREARAQAAEPSNANHYPHVDVINVAFGHPINLSQWGGLDYEFAFYSYRFAGEDHIIAAQIDQWASRTVVSPVIPIGGISEQEAFASDWYPTNGLRNWRYIPYTAVGGNLYNGRGDLQDSRFNFSDTVSVSSYNVSRPISIDWDNPVFMDGQPYTFYPVYGNWGVALYFISSTNESAKIAVARMH